MTGGIAYVLDETGEFTRTRCNPASVDLEPVESAKDIEELRYWIARHAEETGSPRANWILENWEATAAPVRQSIPARVQARAGRSPARRWRRMGKVTWVK